ncbi:MAG: acylneuraminate cytidylyltransferase family protein [Alphaproteobacteria bacterium]
MPRPEILALIPARGGSKGIPRKNLLPVSGRPLIVYPIATALGSSRITRTIVSTDDEEIAAVSRAHGADVPFLRPAEFATDTATDLDVFRHALTWLREHEGYACDLVVHLRATVPVRTPEVVDDAIDRLLARPDAHALRSVSLPHQSPFKMWRPAGEFIEPLVPVPGLPESHSQPRQLLPDVYWQSSYVDIVRSEVVLDLGMIAGHRVLPFVVDHPSPDLDYLEDVPAVEAALDALARGEWPAARRGDRHPG